VSVQGTPSRYSDEITLTIVAVALYLPSLLYLFKVLP